MAAGTPVRQQRLRKEPKRFPGLRAGRFRRTRVFLGTLVLVAIGALAALVWRGQIAWPARNASTEAMAALSRALDVDALTAWAYGSGPVSDDPTVRFYQCRWRQVVQLDLLGAIDSDPRCAAVVPSAASEPRPHRHVPVRVARRREQLYDQAVQLDGPALAELDALAFDDKDATVALSTFDFCACLRHSLFFTRFNVSTPDGSVSLLHNATKVVHAIDAAAQETYKQFWRKVKGANGPFKSSGNDVRRFSCFMAALGNSPFAQLLQVPADAPAGVPRRLLASLHPTEYFGDLAFASTSLQKADKKHYPLAYLLMVHETAPNTEALVRALGDDRAFVLIHLDASSTPEFKGNFSKTLARIAPHPDDPTRHADNIAVIEKTFDVLWGHISIVWAELRGMFELLDRCSFDFVINLSGHDYPLQSNRQVEHLLRPFTNLDVTDADGFSTELGVNFIFDVVSDQAVDRIVYPVFTATDLKSSTGAFQERWWTARNMTYELDNEFPIVRKTSQWFILHRSLINYMRKDWRARLLLAYMEHSMVPDESFFATYILSTPLFSDNQVPRRRSNDPKRLIFWGGRDWRHPKLLLWNEDRDMVMREATSQRSWFMRKIDVTREKQLHHWIDEHRNRTASAASVRSLLPPGWRQWVDRMLRYMDANPQARAVDAVAAVAGPPSVDEPASAPEPPAPKRRQGKPRKPAPAAGKQAPRLRLRAPALAIAPAAAAFELPADMEVSLASTLSPSALQAVESRLSLTAYAVAAYLSTFMGRDYEALLVPVRPT